MQIQLQLRASTNSQVLLRTATIEIPRPAPAPASSTFLMPAPGAVQPLSCPTLLSTFHHRRVVPRLLLAAGGGSFSPTAACACGGAPAAHCGRHDSAGDRPHWHDPASAQGAAAAPQQPSGSGPVHDAHQLQEAAQEPATRPAHLLHAATGHRPQIHGAPQQCCCCCCRCCCEVACQTAAAPQSPVCTCSPPLVYLPGGRQLQAHAFNHAATAVTAASVSRGSDRPVAAALRKPQQLLSQSCASSTVTSEGV